MNLIKQFYESTFLRGLDDIAIERVRQGLGGFGALSKEQQTQLLGFELDVSRRGKYSEQELLDIIRKIKGLHGQIQYGVQNEVNFPAGIQVGRNQLFATACAYSFSPEFALSNGLVSTPTRRRIELLATRHGFKFDRIFKWLTQGASTRRRGPAAYSTYALGETRSGERCLYARQEGHSSAAGQTKIYFAKSSTEYATAFDGNWHRLKQAH